MTPTGFREGHRVHQVLANSTDTLQELFQDIRAGCSVRICGLCGGRVENRCVRIERSTWMTVLFKTIHFIGDWDLRSLPAEDRELCRVESSWGRHDSAAVGLRSSQTVGVDGGHRGENGHGWLSRDPDSPWAGWSWRRRWQGPGWRCRETGMNTWCRTSERVCRLYTGETGPHGVRSCGLVTRGRAGRSG